MGFILFFLTNAVASLIPLQVYEYYLVNATMMGDKKGIYIKIKPRYKHYIGVYTKNTSLLAING